MRDGAASLLTGALLLALIAIPLAGFTLLGGVSFAAPTGFLLAAVAVPLLLLYMLKARRPKRTVASLIFWAPIAQQQQTGTPFARLRRNLVLVLQLLALAALVYGLARPVVQSHLREGISQVLVIDVSASMSTADVGGRTRFDAARAAILQRVQSMGLRDEATIIAADRSAWTVVPWTRDAGALERGLAGLRPRHTGTVLGEALLLAASSAATASGQAQVHLFSDGGGPPPPPTALGGPLIYHPQGTSGENLGLVSLRAQPKLGAGEDAGAGELPYEVFANVRNGGREARSVFVGLERGGDVLAARRIDVPAGAERPAILEARLPPGPVAVRLFGEDRSAPLDPLPLDDVAHVIIPKELGVPVGLVAAQPSPALERALVAGGARLQRFSPAEFDDDPRLRLVVFEGTVPASLPPRDCLLVAPPRAVGPLQVAAGPRPVTPVAWDRDDPLLRYVELADVDVTEARPLIFGGGARVLVQGEQADGAPAVLVASWSDGPARRVAIGFDLYRSTWPLRASFPIFLRNCLEAAGERDRLARGGVTAGVPLPLPVAGDVREVVIETPDGEATIDAWGGQAYFAGTDRVGVYTARAGDAVEQFVVEIGDPSESVVAPRPTFSAGDQLAQAPTDAGRPAEVARWFAMIALVLLTIEFWAYHRRLD